MRPDMWLCNKDWNILPMNETQPLSLDYLVALFNTSFAVWGKGRPRCPRGPHELACILTHTGLHKLLNMSPIDVLLFGNQRHCKMYRAEAIMSVIGSTSWYSAQTAATSSPGSSREKMLENKYPLDFVEETRQKLCPIFSTAVNITLFSKMFELDFQNRVSDTRIRATMMPFSFFVRDRRVSVVDGLAAEDHPAVQSWEIQNDGEVKIPSAGVVASWPSDTLSPRTKATVKATLADFSFSGEYDLAEWLGSFRPNAEKRAICLLRDFNREDIFISWH
jgi:hypothetical protein